MPSEDWTNALLEMLSAAGEDGRQAALYLRARGTRIGFWRVRRSVGAFWTVFGRIYLNSQYYTQATSLTNPYLLSLLVHEACHLRQGALIALSVYGELEAWQVGFRFYHTLTGSYPNHPAVTEILYLPLSWERPVLKQAQGLMRVYAGKGYRADLLPLYPLPLEIRYWWTGKQPS